MIKGTSDKFETNKIEISCNLNSDEQFIFELVYFDKKLSFDLISKIFNSLIQVDDKTNEEFINLFSVILQIFIYGISVNLLYNTKIVKFIVNTLNEKIKVE